MSIDQGNFQCHHIGCSRPGYYGLYGRIGSWCLKHIPIKHIPTGEPYYAEAQQLTMFPDYYFTEDP